ncbi:MAG: hypothetical protein ACRDE5_08920, partial [Ginsengibacter sp.]
MKTKHVLLCLSIVSIITFEISCKGSSASTTLTGNWVTESDLDGVARSEAVSFVLNDTAYIGT